MSLITTISVLLAVVFGGSVGYYFRFITALGKKGSVEIEVKKMLLDAKEEAERISTDAKKKADEYAVLRSAEFKEKDQDIKKTEERLIRKEELLDKRQTDLDAESEKIKLRNEEVQKEHAKAEALIAERAKMLEKVAGLTMEEAKASLFAVVEKQSEEDISVRMQKLERDGVERFDKKAKDILTTAIHRIGNAMNADVVSSTVSLPSDEIKGKIIGKEGRNIRAFERATGVDVIIDDTPGIITLSSFDPIRRQVAKAALENLIVDGRIQPAKIEEMVVKAKEDINVIIKKKGEEAAFEAGVLGLDPRLLIVLGRLYFRTSYGQNVLAHSVECALIAGIIATEVGADPAIARAGALLHDIGKALDHDVQGTHVEIGRKILAKFGVDERVIRSMESHHEEYPYTIPESYIVQVADSVSGSRPGARRDSVEQYIKRMEDLEATVNAFPGIEKSYALSAGREVRVFVRPGEISDVDARKLARDIALKIESELKYPGEIKVNVIRETRSIEFAR